jgi:hypothetical protein
MVYVLCLLWGLFVAFVLPLAFWPSVLLSFAGAVAITFLVPKPKK